MLKYLLLIMFMTTVAHSTPLKVKSSEVTFVAVGTPGFLKIEGTGSKLVDVKVDLTKGVVKGHLSALLTELETGMDTRDEHMKEKYLDTAKHPKATLDLKGEGGKFTGNLTIKGETKAVKGTYSIKAKKLSAKFKVKIKDYPAIGVPSWLGVTIADSVDVSVSATIE
jgi:polyisoprenoid-binding protein YceI